MLYNNLSKRVLKHRVQGTKERAKSPHLADFSPLSNHKKYPLELLGYGHRGLIARGPKDGVARNVEIGITMQMLILHVGPDVR